MIFHGLTRERFWVRMEDEGRLHPSTRPSGASILRGCLRGLRACVTSLIRDLAWSVQASTALFEKDEGALFRSSSWASFFRSRIALGAVRSDYDGRWRGRSSFAKTGEAAALPRYRGK